jgi:hypothetical protein
MAERAAGCPWREHTAAEELASTGNVIFFVMADETLVFRGLARCKTSATNRA